MQSLIKKGTLTVSGSTFNNNQATSGGGAIINVGTLTVSGSTFNNNQAKNLGGAIYNRDGTLTVSISTFDNNQAYSGGAILNQGSGTLNVSGSTFNNNQANGLASRGGAIWNGGTLTVSGSTFNNNQATTVGGAINNNGGTLTVSGSTFINNQASSGGAIFNRDSATLTVLGSTFINNQAFSGGAINNEGTLTVSISVFYNNTGNKEIYSDNISNLTDNFYLNPTITVLNELLDDFTNEMDSVHGLYYFKVSHNFVNYIGETLKFNFLSYYGDNKPSINQLPDLDISLNYNGQLFNDFNYKNENGVKLDSVANDFEFGFMGIDFGLFNVDVEEKKQNDNLVLGLPTDPTIPEDFDEDSSKNGSIQDETVNGGTVNDETVNGGTVNDETVNGVTVNDETVNGVTVNNETVNGGAVINRAVYYKTGGSEDNHLAKNSNPNNNPNNPIKKATNSYTLANVVYAVSNEVNETNELQQRKNVGKSYKLSEKTNNWNLGIILIAILFVLAVVTTGFYLKKKN